MSSDRAWHSQREPDASARRFAEEATFASWQDESRAAFEVTVFQDGTVYLACPRIVAEDGKRMVIPDTALMFGDMDEAKDAIDLILDRLGAEAGGSPVPAEVPVGDRGSRVDARSGSETAPTSIFARLQCGPPVDGETLADLIRHVTSAYGTELPEDYLGFLRIANGADGTLENGAPSSSGKQSSSLR